MQPSRETARWQLLLRESADPLAILDRRRRIRFANAAFESWCGLPFGELRSRTCRRRAHPADRAEAVLAALAPPAEVLDGSFALVRRRFPAPDATVWCDLAFLPWTDPAGGFSVLVRARPANVQGEPLRLPDSIVRLQFDARRRFRIDELDGGSPARQRLAAQLRLASKSDVPVLFQGPNGSGREHWARTLHLIGPRANLPFAAIDAALVPPAAAEEWLFDPPRRRRFGAILVKHPERLPRELQARWHETIEADDASSPRWLAAASEHPDRTPGAWHPGLAAAFGVFVVAVPPLRESAEGLPQRLEALLPAACEAAGRPLLPLAPAALEWLVRQPWPGDAAEAAIALRDAAGRARGERIEIGDLPYHLRAEPIPQEEHIPLDEVLARTERRMIEAALAKAGNNRSKAAAALGIWRARLLRRMEHFGIGGPAEPDTPSAEE